MLPPTGWRPSRAGYSRLQPWWCRSPAHTWDLAALQLRDHYHIIALDQRGHGDSDWTPDSQLAGDGWNMIADLEAFIDHLGDERIVLVGMSIGSLNAIRYAGRHSDRLAAVGIVDVAPQIENAGKVLITDFDRATETLSSFDNLLQRSVQYMPYRPVAHLQYSLTHALKRLSGWTLELEDNNARRRWRVASEILAQNGTNGAFYDTLGRRKKDLKRTDAIISRRAEPDTD